MEFLRPTGDLGDSAGAVAVGVEGDDAAVGAAVGGEVKLGAAVGGRLTRRRWTEGVARRGGDALLFLLAGERRAHVRRTRFSPQRMQRSTVKSLPCFTSKRPAVSTCHLWKPERHRVLCVARDWRAAFSLTTLVVCGWLLIF